MQAQLVTQSEFYNIFVFSMYMTPWRLTYFPGDSRRSVRDHVGKNRSCADHSSFANHHLCSSDHSLCFFDLGSITAPLLLHYCYAVIVKEEVGNSSDILNAYLGHTDDQIHSKRLTFSEWRSIWHVKCQVRSPFGTNTSSSSFSII